MFCGYGGLGSLTLYLAAQRWNFDPIYHATCSIVVQHAVWIWGSRVTLSRFQRAWMCLRDSSNERVSQDTRASAQGPLSSLWLTLRGINWNVASSTILVDDEGARICLLRTSPSEVQFFLHRSLDRWQSHHILNQLPEAPPAMMKGGASTRGYVRFASGTLLWHLA